MNNRHIAFFSLPAHAHVHPTVPIVAALVRRGYRVTYVTSRLFEPKVTAVGAEFVPCRPFENDDDIYCRLGLRTLEEVSSFYEKNTPDLVIYDFVSFAGRILANKWKIPAIQTSPHFALEKEYFSRQVGDAELRKDALEASEKADRFLERYGVDAGDFIFYRERLNVYLFPRIFEPCKEAIGDNCFHAGRCAGEQPDYGDWRKGGDESRPIALVSTSSTYSEGADYFRMCMDAFAGLQWHVVLSIADGDPSSLGLLPAHFEIVQRVSQPKILRHASLFIFSGGSIGAAEAAYHGVPAIVTSCGNLGLEWLGENLAKVGLALHLKKPEMSVDSIRKYVSQIENDIAMAHRVKQIQRAVRREPGAEETANRIEDYLDSIRQ